MIVVSETQNERRGVYSICPTCKVKIGQHFGQKVIEDYFLLPASCQPFTPLSRSGLLKQSVARFLHLKASRQPS